VCGGNGSHCQQLSGSKRLAAAPAGDYLPLATLPADCWNLRIVSNGTRGNVLALRTVASGKRLLNWDRTVRQPGRYALSSGLPLYVDYDRQATASDGHMEVVEAQRSLGKENVTHRRQSKSSELTKYLC